LIPLLTALTPIDTGTVVFFPTIPVKVRSVHVNPVHMRIRVLWHPKVFSQRFITRCWLLGRDLGIWCNPVLSYGIIGVLNLNHTIRSWCIGVIHLDFYESYLGHKFWRFPTLQRRGLRIAVYKLLNLSFENIISGCDLIRISPSFTSHHTRTKTFFFCPHTTRVFHTAVLRHGVENINWHLSPGFKLIFVLFYLFVSRSSQGGMFTRESSQNPFPLQWYSSPASPRNIQL